MFFLQDLNPYIDELLQQPEFRRFLDLPVELRYEVYEQCFLDDTGTIGCHSWPALSLTKGGVDRIRKRKTAPFLPKIGLLSRDTHCEVIDCLMRSMHLETQGPRATLSLFKQVLGGARVLRGLRKLSILDLNGQKNKFELTGPRGEEMTKSLLVAATSLTRLCSNSLRLFAGLRELTLQFHAPLRIDRSLLHTNSSLCSEALDQPLSRRIRDRIYPWPERIANDHSCWSWWILQQHQLPVRIPRDDRTKRHGGLSHECDGSRSADQGWIQGTKS